MRVVIADDEVLMREGLSRLLTEVGLEVVATAGDGQELMRRVALDQPDVAIVDIKMPPTHTDEGLAAALAIRERYPAVGVLVLSHYLDSRYALRLLEHHAAGAGYLLKERVSDVLVLVDALRRVAEGECVVDPTIVSRLLGRRRIDSPLERLTDRERDVLALMAEGHSNNGIATRLVLSPKTVERHVGHIFPVWSPDRSQVAFERDFPDHAVVVIVNADGSAERVLDVGCVSPCQDVNEPSWTPDGTRIVFTLVIGPFDQPGESATSAVLWTANLDGSDVRRLSEPGIDGQYEDGHARFSPDGSYLIFERAGTGTVGAAVFRMDSNGTNLRQLTPWALNADTADLSQAQSGPTRDLVVFETYGHGGPPPGAKEDVATVPTTCLSVTECTSQIRYVTANGSGPKDSNNPTWSPDGTHMAFVEFVQPATARGFKYADIYTVDAQGGNRHQVSTTSTWNFRPDW